MKTNDTIVTHSAGAKSVDNGKPSSAYRWLGVVLFAMLAISCALSFLKYLGAATFYSGNLGLPSRASGLQVAGHNALVFFWVFVALEGLTTLVMASLIRLPELWSTAVRFLARVAIALALSLIATGAVIEVLVAVGSKLR